MPRSFTFRLPLRNIFRARRRSLYTVLGIAFAMVLSVVTVSMFDSIDYLMSTHVLAGRALGHRRGLRPAGRPEPRRRGARAARRRPRPAGAGAAGQGHARRRRGERLADRDDPRRRLPRLHGGARAPRRPRRSRRASIVLAASTATKLDVGVGQSVSWSIRRPTATRSPCASGRFPTRRSASPPTSRSRPAPDITDEPHEPLQRAVPERRRGGRESDPGRDLRHARRRERAGQGRARRAPQEPDGAHQRVRLGACSASARRSRSSSCSRRSPPTSPSAPARSPPCAPSARTTCGSPSW